MKTLQTNYNPDVLSCLANLSNDEVLTPPNLVNNILDLLPKELWSNLEAKFLDPVCKSGVFLREIAKRLMIGLEKKLPDKQKRINHIFENQLYGIAITESTALLSRRSVYCSKTAKGKPKSFDNAVTLYQNGGIGFVKESEIKTNIGIINLFKTLIPPLGSGSDSFPHQILGKPFVAEPNSACTETYLVAGVFKNRKEAENLAKYLTTRFLRFLVLLNKPTQHATSKVYTFVPIQDFNDVWTDEKLYKKYGLTKEEIAFIESMIRPMENVSITDEAD